MQCAFEYVVENYTQSDLSILNSSLIPNMKKNADLRKTTLDKVIKIVLKPNLSNLDIDIDIILEADLDLLNNAIHGGLAKALGKGRVKKR